MRVNVLNYGTLRAIAKVPAGGSLVLGPGSFALTAEAPGQPDEMLLRAITGESGDTLDITLDPEADIYDTLESPGFWLTYPEEDGDPRRRENLVSDPVDRHHRLLVAADNAERKKLRQLDETEQAVLDSLPNELRADWETILEKPCDSFAPFIRLLTWYRTDVEKRSLTWLLVDGDDKDLLEMNERMARAHVDGALAVRGKLPEDVWREGVLSSRIAREPAKDWRSELPICEPTADALPATFGREWSLSEPHYFGNPLPPDEAFMLHRGTETDLKVAFVGLCRRNGVPARYRHGQVQWWFDGWQDVEPWPQDDADVVSEVAHQSTKMPGQASQSAWIDLSLTRGGVTWHEAESYRHFMVSRPGNGHFQTPWWDPRSGVQEWPVGTYWYCATVRVPGGSAFGRLTRFAVAAGDTTHVTLSADLSEGGWDPAALVDKELATSFQGLGFSTTEGALYLIFEPGEPATRMIPILARLQNRLDARGVPIVPVLVGGDVAEWRRKVADVGLAGSLMVDKSSALRQWLAGPGKNGPVTALYLPGAEEGRPVLLRTGLDNGMDFSVHLALDLY